MNKFKRSFICLAVFSMIVFSGQAGRAEEILVGFSGPLSSIGAEYGQDISTGIELAIKDINDRGGVLVGGKKYTFRLDRKDDRFDSTQALNNARRFRSEGTIAGMKTMPDGEAKRFALRYEGIYKRMATWECTVNYALMHSLARAIVAAQSVDDVYKIRAAYAKALPMNLPEFPMEILGVSGQGRWRVFTSIQAMNSGKLDVIMQYAWWVKSEAEFSAASKLSKMHTQGIVQKWHKTAD